MSAESPSADSPNKPSGSESKAEMLAEAQTGQPALSAGVPAADPALSQPAYCLHRHLLRCAGGSLPPAGGFSSPLSILNAARDLRQMFAGSYLESRAEFENRFAQAAGAARLLTYGSGKESLFNIFRCLKLRKGRCTVAVGAYSCPDIAVAALEAGAEVLPLELNPQTMECVIGGLDKAPDALVLGNLYGLPDDLDPARTSLDGETLIIDDGCQAFLSRTRGGRPGLRPGTIGILSFGRGKALCGLGGGAILFGDRDIENEFAGELEQNRDKTSPRGWLPDLLLGAAMWAFQNRRLYPIPAGLPALGLGTTHPVFDFRKIPLSRAQMLHAWAAWEGREARSKALTANAALFGCSLQGLPLLQPFLERNFNFGGAIVPIRYPIIFESQSVRDSCFRALEAKGLGASRSYPFLLNEYTGLAGRIPAGRLAGARRISECILTLPVHAGVRLRDIQQTVGIIRKQLGGAP